MYRPVLLSFVALSICLSGITCLQLPEASELQQPDDDFETQIKNLQRNVSDIWTYIYELRSAVSNHLTHLRQHQMELESSMHKMEHLHESELSSSGHHHSGEQHSHSGEQHSHSGEHSHGSDHSHGSMEQHSHSGEQHSHSGEQHSHSGEHHSHSGEHGHHSHSYSHSHDQEDSHSHSHGDDHHHHGTDEKDNHESDDLQTQQAVDPVAEPIVVPTSRQEHYHRHSHSHQSSRSGSPGMNLINERGLHHHHHHHHQDNRQRNRTVELPRYSDYGQFDLAICRVQPNRAIPENQQQDVEGTVTLWQKKTGGPLNFHVKLQGFDVGGHHGHHQAIQQEEDNEANQAVGHRHGFHIHAFGDLSNGCQSTGPHYNPKGVNHGGPHALVRHVGDLGNIECDEHGNTNILFSDNVASLRGQYSVLGKGIVIHSLVDDLGLGGDAGSLSTGNAGSRLACCFIQKIDKIPLQQYKAMKIATQHQNR